jgi:hypothetical protein
MTEGGFEGIWRKGVVAETPNAPEGAHDRRDRGIEVPRSAFVPSVPKAKALKPPRKNFRRFSMVIPAFRAFLVLQEIHPRKTWCFLQSQLVLSLFPASKPPWREASFVYQRFLRL